jgi:large subunit ribosomal protein L19e
MKLDKKKKLAAKVLNVGKGKIIFDNARLDEIKEAITRQDIRDLARDGAIKIKQKTGRRKTEKRRNKRKEGNIKKKIKKRKEEYTLTTRKLRNYAKELKRQGRIDILQYKDLRNKIKSKFFKSKGHLKEYLKEPLRSQK